MGSINWGNSPTEIEQRTNLASRLSKFRKEAEAEGVVVEGARFSGDPANRQALNEALQMAERMGNTIFSSWKDSDDKFHSEFPVAKVEEALLAIGTRRQALIAKEAAYAQQVMNGEIDNIRQLDWTV